MSYCSIPRLTFSGRFQADVSTVNNDVRHYDNKTFESRFQLPQEREGPFNGWWNPDGTGAFRLVDVSVQQALNESGTVTDDPAVDLRLNSQSERPAAKLVDLDPQFQMASAIWGMRVVLTDGKVEYMRADFRPASFRDINFARGPRGVPPSGKFTSVLTNVAFAAEAQNSPVLTALRELSEANGHRLSINLLTYGYSTRVTYGLVAGSIGPWLEGEPHGFLLGRRFSPVWPRDASGRILTPFVNQFGIGYFDADLHRQLSVDLSNAWPFELDGSMRNLGDLKVVVLREPDVEENITGGAGQVRAGIAEGALITADQYLELGQVPYRDPDWLTKTAGLVDFPLTDEARQLASTHPLALIVPNPANPDQWVVVMRESIGGLFVRADDFIHRVDGHKDGFVPIDIRLFAARRGQRIADLPIECTARGRESDSGGSDPTAPDPPTASIPDIGVPVDLVRFQNQLVTNSDGLAETQLHAGNPAGVRDYIDGQIYKVDYNIRVDGVSDSPLFDHITLHVRDAYEPPESPDWETDIAPILIQFGNLYPIMSKGLFSFSDPDILKQNARLMVFAMSLPIEDPNHMPVTRDLSEGKRQAVLNWLQQFLPEDEAVPQSVAAHVSNADNVPPPGIESTRSGLPPADTETLIQNLGDSNDGKIPAMRDAILSQLGSRS